MDKAPVKHNPLVLMLLIGCGFAIGYGFMTSMHLNLTQKIATFAFIVLIQWLIWRSGRAGAWADAHAWAKNQVDIAISNANEAIANADAKALSYSHAIASAEASAIATNSTIVQLSTIVDPKELANAVHELAMQQVQKDLENKATTIKELTPTIDTTGITQ